MSALQSGQDEVAYQLARQAYRIAPDDPQVVFLMAMVFGDRKRFPEAIQMLDELAVTTPEVRLPVLGQTAEWMVRFGQFDQAEQRYRELLQQVPDAALVHRNLSQLLLRQGRRSEAAEYLSVLCSIGDIMEDELRALLRISHPLAGDVTDEVFDPIGTLGQARVDVARGDLAAARTRLEAVRERSEEEDALLGRIYVQLEDHAALQTWRSEQTGSSDRYADAWLAKGAAAAEQGDHVTAVRCFAECVLRDPTDAPAYRMMSRSLRETGAESEATAHRADLIEQTVAIGARMAAQETRDDAAFSKLIELLDQLHRPLESLAWRGIQLAYSVETSARSESQPQQLLNEVATERAKLLRSNRAQASRRFVLCGVDLDAFD
ncbi:tetratricopeptide repeat protein [Stieleria maiorica]|uniref:Tetratricopeptide repeat protein n=2 Tax=Stieleria maiorica TaxID=2795974 RepID=A0A5B9MCZ5_9BACT|nr:tetratricopeptide repeat protein [Stieleria maiorica]